MTEFTPTTEQVKESWCEPRTPAQAINFDYHYDMEEAFDRWLAEHDRETSEKAWDEGYTKRGSDEWCRIFRQNFTRTKNPYQEEPDNE